MVFYSFCIIIYHIGYSEALLLGNVWNLYCFVLTNHSIALSSTGIMQYCCDNVITSIVLYCIALCTGIWGIGLATQSCNLHKVPLGADGNSWVLRHDGILGHNGNEIGRLEDLPQEGDIIVSCGLLCIFLLHDSSLSFTVTTGLENLEILGM